MGNTICKKCDVNIKQHLLPTRYSCRVHNYNDLGICIDCDDLYVNCRHKWKKKNLCIFIN